MNKESEVKRAFSITFVQHEDESYAFQFKEIGEWNDLEKANLLHLVHERLMKNEEENMQEVVDAMKDLIEIK